ncbi:MAG: hypothetical protein CL398_00270 [Acidiferrobacteraceae bacterium]|nr:hypothetical protein [Acidiferrobacteraceae bacterium]|tara:strand:+ start:1642 stop:2631 length:990 start_codon:yes stop_codon:yes gene_type:complete
MVRFRSGESYIAKRTLENALTRRQGQVTSWLEAAATNRNEPFDVHSQVGDFEEWVKKNWSDFTPKFPSDAFEEKYTVPRNYAYTKLDLMPLVAVKQAKQRKRDDAGKLATTWTFVSPGNGGTENLPVEGDLSHSGGWLGPFQTKPNNGEFRTVMPIDVIADGDAVAATERGFYDPVTDKTYGFTKGSGYRGDFSVLDSATALKLDDLDTWATEEPRLLVGQPYFKRRGQWQKSKMGVGFLIKTKEPLKINAGNWNSRNYVNQRVNAGMTQDEAEKIETLKTPNGYVYFSPMSSNQRLYITDPVGILMKKFMAINWPFTTITRALYTEDE